MTKALIAAGMFAAAPVLVAPLRAAALELHFPGPAEATAQRREAATSFRLPIGAYLHGSMATEFTEGALDQAAWRVAVPLSTLELLHALRDQITAAGFKVIFECETQACGGFDFRYATDVLPEPDMHIDLGDFRYLAASKPGPDGTEYLNLLVSRSPQDRFVQLTRIGGSGAQLTASTKATLQPAKPQSFALPLPPAPSENTDLAPQLATGLPLVLEDLIFASGSADLAAGDYASLRDLAAWLRANPGQSLTLVGHTDASGALANNIALSKQRAASVRRALIKQFDIPAAQIASNGVGPLSPRDSNLTETGRQKNRRVEVFTTPTQ
ncbi:MAG: OmpA family protein [Cypionkella sp.]|uniref:OmpA family protein n=1 Tax=Cypionkella sp. TaxID=2811411 RepID=UPI002724A7CE|nr:OmpA family protein [Cypionkella sp.]MDO8328761.1 OmpA family protein [Cypionkella sp.]